MALTAAWLVLVLIASWAPPARADDASQPGGQSAVDTNTPPSPPPDSSTGTTGADQSGQGTTSASDPNAGSTTQTPPADPPPATQDTAPPVDSSPPATSTDTPSSTSGTGSPTDTTAGGTSASDPSNDVSKASPSKAGSDSTPSGTSDAIPAAPVAPTALSQGPPLPGATPADQVWVEQWSAFTREDVTGTLRASLKPAIHLALALGRAGGFVFFPTSKAKRIEARERQRGETAKASALRPGLTASGATGPGAGLFDLFTGGGGGGTITIYVFLGILAVTLLPIPSRTTAFRLPAVIWRPSAYVPPIEQPG